MWIAMVVRRRGLDHGIEERKPKTSKHLPKSTWGKRSRGRPRLRRKNTVTRDVKAWSMRIERATVWVKSKCICKIRNTPHREKTVKGGKAYGTQNYSSHSISSSERRCPNVSAKSTPLLPHSCLLLPSRCHRTKLIM